MHLVQLQGKAGASDAPRRFRSLRVAGSRRGGGAELLLLLRVELSLLKETATPENLSQPSPPELAPFSTSSECEAPVLKET